jgi:hypothetical protein
VGGVNSFILRSFILRFKGIALGFGFAGFNAL